MSEPRIQPGDRKAVGIGTTAIARVSGLVSGSRSLNLFLVLGRHRKLFRGWLRFAGRLMPGGTLPRRETELVILRVAHLRACAYEEAHHQRLARRVKVTEQDLERVRQGPDAPGWSDRERAILRAVEELHHTQDLTDETWAELRRHLDEKGAIELVLLAAHYEMLATAITALRIPLDEPRRADRR